MRCVDAKRCDFIEGQLLASLRCLLAERILHEKCRNNDVFSVNEQIYFGEQLGDDGNCIRQSFIADDALHQLHNIGFIDGKCPAPSNPSKKNTINRKMNNSK